MRGVSGSRDSTGHWLRTAVVLDPNLSADILAPGACAAPTVCFNAFPAPGDALDPQPYEPGSYPRLKPFDPPPPPE